MAVVCGSARYVSTVRTITGHQLHDDSAEILGRVEAGESFLVTRDGHPIAEIRPVPASVPAGRQRFVSREHLLALVQDMEPIDSARFRADLDAVTDPRFEARASPARTS